MLHVTPPTTTILGNLFPQFSLLSWVDLHPAPTVQHPFFKPFKSVMDLIIIYYNYHEHRQGCSHVISIQTCPPPPPPHWRGLQSIPNRPCGLLPRCTRLGCRLLQTRRPCNQCARASMCSPLPRATNFVPSIPPP
jgi:hypothetical protein